MLSKLALYLILFYSVVFLTQLFHYIASPLNKSRLRYLILLLSLCAYVFASDILPNEDLPIPLIAQIIIEWSTAFVLFLYLVYFVNSFLDLSQIKGTLIKTAIIFLVVPFLFLFVLPSLIFDNFILIKRVFVVIPFTYAIWFIYFFNSHIRKGANNIEVAHLKLKLSGVNITCVGLMFLAVSVFFNLDAFYELLISNFGFIILSLVYLLVLILDTQKDYQKLAENEKQLTTLNETLQEKVKERTKELEQTIEQRTNIFINLAHETRTPLTIIKNTLNVLGKNNTNSKEITCIKNNIERLQDQIGKIINIEKVELGQADYAEDVTINLSDFISEKLEMFSPYAANKKIQLKPAVQPNILIKASWDDVNSLVDNLVENAIKYTSTKGSITVTMNVESSNIIVSVEDTGIGMPDNEIKKIFEPYYRIGQAGQKSYGMGIGLSIVNNIVKRLDGEIRVKSRLNKGSKFTIVLKHDTNLSINNVAPDKVFTNLPTINTQVEDALSDPQLSTILIIEDNTELLIYLKDNLKNKYNILAANSGLCALKRIREYKPKPDLIISDVMMEEMDGVTFYEKLKETELNYIPIIYITAKANSIDRDKALAKGALDYIYKPFEISEVRKKVDSIIIQSKKQRNIAIESVKKILDTEKDKLISENAVHFDSFDTRCSVNNISTREKEIIKLAYLGRSYKEISNELNISKKTVDNHFQNIYKKVGVNKQQELFSFLFSENN